MTRDYVVKEYLTLYAHFNQNEEFVTISFNTDGGTSVSNRTIKNGTKIGNLPLTEKVGYTFIGWFTSADEDNQVFEDDIFDEDTTLYACYEKQDIDTVLPEFTEVSIDSDDVTYEIKLKSEIEIDEKIFMTILV